MTTQSTLQGNILIFIWSILDKIIWSKMTVGWNLWIITFPGQADNKKEFKLHKKSKPFAYWSVHPGAFYKGESYLTFFTFLVTKNFLADILSLLNQVYKLTKNHSFNFFYHMVFQQRRFLFFSFFLNHATFLHKVTSITQEAESKI